PNTRGQWEVKWTQEGLEFLNRVGGEPLGADDAILKEYAHAALAKWSVDRNSDYIEGRDQEGRGQIKLLARDTNCKVMDDPEHGTSTRLQGVGPYLDLLEGLPPKDNLPEQSLYMSKMQIVASERFFLGKKGFSGTANEFLDEFYEDFGLLVANVDPYYT